MTILVSAVATKTTTFKDGPTNCRHQFFLSEPIEDRENASIITLEYSISICDGRSILTHSMSRFFETKALKYHFYIQN